MVLNHLLFLIDEIEEHAEETDWENETEEEFEEPSDEL
jgi:hypothetical protein